MLVLVHLLYVGEHSDSLWECQETISIQIAQDSKSKEEDLGIS